MTALLALLLFIFVCETSTQAIDSNADVRRFLDRQEEVVIDIAKNAALWHSNRTLLVRDCKCSKHACSNNYLDAECVHHLGELEICETDGRRVDYDNSVFHTPPGTNPKTLTDSLKESICVYKNLEDAVKEYGRDEIGWIYIGKCDSSCFGDNGFLQEREMVTFDDIQVPRIHAMWRTGTSCGIHADCSTLASAHGMSEPVLDRRILFWWWTSLGLCWTS